MDKMWRAVMIVCAALLLVSIALKNRTSRGIPAPAVFPVLSSGRVSVKVRGDVLYPGIYEVPANALAVSVINMAEPLRPLNRLTIDASARHLQHGSAVSLVEHPDGTSQLTADQMSVAEHLVLRIPLDISTMNEADFDRLPGIGPALARRIIECRHKNGGILRVEDLSAVEGIGEKKFKMISKYFQPP